MKVLGALLAGGILMWLVFNLLSAFVVGWLARKLLPVNGKVGWGTTILVGFIGGIVGRIAFQLLHWPTRFGMGFVASLAGAMVLLLVYHVWSGAKGGSSAS